MAMAMQSPVCQPRWSTLRTNRPTYGGKAAQIAASLGTPFMPWQQHVADVALEVDPKTGLLVYTDVVLTVPRQSGKTTLVLAKTLLRCQGMGPNQRSVYTAQTGSDARAKWQDDWLPQLVKSPFKSKYRARLTNGHEALIFTNGSIQSLISTTKDSGHGGSIDDATLDEAFAHSDARLEQALAPAMITRAQPQLWVVSTAGTPEDSPYLLGKVKAGRAAVEAGMVRSTCYFEWSAADEDDPGDPATWWGCMPALGFTVTEAAVQSKFDSMPLNEFERAFLNRWKAGLSNPVIPLERWLACLDPSAVLGDPLCLAFDVNPERSRGAVGACGPGATGLPVVDAVDCRDGVDWLPAELLRLRDKHRPAVIVCHKGSPAGSLLPELEVLGIVEKKDRNGNPAPGSLLLLDGADYAKACGLFYDRVIEAKVAHRDQPELVLALDGAKKRLLGDAWAWSRKSSSVDISPLVTVTLALWAHSQAPTPASKYEQETLVAM